MTPVSTKHENLLYLASTKTVAKKLEDLNNALSDYVHDLAVFDRTVPNANLTEITNTSENLIALLQPQIERSMKECADRLGEEE